LTIEPKRQKWKSSPGTIDVPTAEAVLYQREAAMELFLAERIGSVRDGSVRDKSGSTCRFCQRKLILVRTMVVSDSGVVVDMFECRCGERIWKD
jgi:hypothetical protein